MTVGLEFRTSGELDAGPVTPGGQSRMKAFADDGFWSGLATVDTGGQWASWHHHAGYDSIFVIKTGSLMYHDGATDREVVMETGDWSFIPPGAVHRAKTLSDTPCEYVYFRRGQGESVVNVPDYQPGGNADAREN